MYELPLFTNTNMEFTYLRDNSEIVSIVIDTNVSYIRTIVHSCKNDYGLDIVTGYMLQRLDHPFRKFNVSSASYV